jgi:hypothetical protein
VDFAKIGEILELSCRKDSNCRALVNPTQITLVSSNLIGSINRVGADREATRG